MNQYFNSLKSKRISRKVFWFFNIISFTTFLALAIFISLEMPYNIAIIVIVILTAIAMLIRFFVIVMRANDISPDLQENLWEKGLAAILGRWLLWFAPSYNSKTNPSETFGQRVLQEPRKMRFYLFVKNGFLYIAIVAVAFIIYFILKN